MAETGGESARRYLKLLTPRFQSLRVWSPIVSIRSTSKCFAIYQGRRSLYPLERHPDPVVLSAYLDLPARPRGSGGLGAGILCARGEGVLP
jgi:hypothetical protein